MAGGENDDILSQLQDPTLDTGGEIEGDDGIDTQQAPQQRQPERVPQTQARETVPTQNAPRQNTQQRPAQTQQQQRPNNVQPQQTTGDEPPKQVRRLGNTQYLTDERGNVRDSNGNVIALAGRERRFWQENMRNREQITGLVKELTDLRGKADGANTLNGLPKAYGLSDDEVRESMAIVKEFKSNPVAAAKNVLARALALGYKLPDIIGDVAKGAPELQTAAMKRMLDDRLGPIAQQTEQTQNAERQAQEREQAARRDYLRFLDEHPNADIHEQDIVSLIRQNEAEGIRMNPTQSYYALREFAVRHGLDFNMPLREQVEALRSQQQQQPNPQQRRQQPRTPSGMRTLPATTAQVTSEPEHQSYGDESDWKDILRQEAQRTGFGAR